MKDTGKERKTSNDTSQRRCSIIRVYDSPHFRAAFTALM